MKVVFVVAVITLSAVAAFIFLPIALGREHMLVEADSFILFYVLCFMLLVSIGLKSISYLSLPHHEKIYLAVVVAALQFLIWDGTSHVLGVPQLKFDFEAERANLSIVTTPNDFNALGLWICLIATVAVYSLGRQFLVLQSPQKSKG